jgi:hypothetical protein
MATIASNVLTLADWAKRVDPNGKTPIIAEMLNQSNEILDTMLFKEGNLATGERVTIRTGLPTVYYRQMNAGVPSSKSTTSQITENAAELTALSEVDKSIADLEANTNDFRLSESMAFVEAMAQKQAGTLFYGSAANPEEFVGLSNRYSSLSANSGENIIDAGGTGGDNSSIWLIGWGPRSLYGVFPKGSKAGLMHTDRGEEWAFDGNNNRYLAYMDYYCWKNGLVVKDWRYAVRVANIDISVLVADPTGATTNLLNLMTDAMHRIPSLNGSEKFSFYVNRTVGKMLDIQAANKSNLQLMVGQEEGKRKVSFRGIPIGICDQLTEAEAQVV